jgi:predicted metalloprotease with PDZ domain
VDYYYEGSMIWMEADVLIREKSSGRLSLDDFLRKFHGGQNSGPRVVTYDLDEIAGTLNSVVAYDWRTFLLDRVYAVRPRAPLGGITNGGWQLVYNDTPNLQLQIDGRRGYVNLAYSIGMNVSADGTVSDINPDLAAAKAGLAPGMRLITVNGQAYSAEALRQAVAATKSGPAQIRLEAANGGTKQTYDLSYQGGERYPHLVRDNSKPDYLSAIARPR